MEDINQTKMSQLNTYLESVQLGGFRCIQDMNASFLPGLNILIGKNGSGKTNFLTLASSVLGFDFEEISEFKADFKIAGETSFRLQLSRQASNAISELDKKEGDVFTAEVKTHYEYHGPEALLFEDRRPGNDVNRKNIPTEGDLEDNLALSRNIERLYGVAMIKHGTPLIFPFVSSPASIERSENGGKSRLPKEVFNSSLPAFSRFLYSHFGFARTFSDEDASESLNKTARELSRVVSSFTQIEDIRFCETKIISKVGEFFKIENLQLEFRINDEWLTFNYLSDGTKRMFYIIAELSFNNLTDYAYKFGRQSITVSSKDGLPFSTITFIEEPELGVHPHQLMRILDFLKQYSEKNQVILTTHAPQALDILEKDELDRINIMTSSKGGGSEIKKLTAKQKSKAGLYKEQAYLRDYWIHSTLEI